MPDDDLLDFGTDDVTVESWIKAAASDERVIVSKHSSNAAEPYWSITVTDDSNHNGQIRAVYFDGTNTSTAYSSAGVLDGAWHHLVLFDRDLDEIALYVGLLPVDESRRTRPRPSPDQALSARPEQVAPRIRLS